MNNALFQKLKSKGMKMVKKNWPSSTKEEFMEWGISPKDIWNHTHPACLSETMGPNWKYGFMLDGRPYAFNEIGNYYRGGKYNG